MNYEIKRLGKNISDDYVNQLVRIHKVCFPDDATNDEDRETIFKSWNNPPIMNYWAAKDENELVGYVRWVEHGGIRPDAVIELEQVGIDPQYQEKGVATRLIDTSLLELSRELGTGNRKIKLVYVSTGNDNFAQGLYRKTLGAKVRGKIPGFYEDSKINADEVIMTAPRDKINEARKKSGLELV